MEDNRSPLVRSVLRQDSYFYQELQEQYDEESINYDDESMGYEIEYIAHD